MFGNLTHLLGTIAIVAGGTAGALGLMDLLLSTKIKKEIEDGASTLWIWLSYQRTWPYVKKVQSPRVFDFAFASVSALLLLAFIISTIADPRRPVGTPEFPEFPHPDTTFIALGIFLLLFPLVPYYFGRSRIRAVYIWMTEKETLLALLLRSFLMLGAAFVGFLVSILLFIAIVKAGQISGLSSLGIASSAVFVLALAPWILGWVSYFFLVAVLFVILYIGAIYALIASFFVLQLVVLRIVEFDKGPLLAIAAFFTGVGAIAKALAG